MGSHIYSMCVVDTLRYGKGESSFTVSEKHVKLQASVRLAGRLRIGFSEVPRNYLLLHKQKSRIVSRPEPGQNVMESAA